MPPPSHDRFTLLCSIVDTNLCNCCWSRFVASFSRRLLHNGFVLCSYCFLDNMVPDALNPPTDQRKVKVNLFSRICLPFLSIISKECSPRQCVVTTVGTRWARVEVGRSSALLSPGVRFRLVVVGQVLVFSLSHHPYYRVIGVLPSYGVGDPIPLYFSRVCY